MGSMDRNGHSQSFKYLFTSFNKAKRGFSLLEQATKPLETQVVYGSCHTSQYYHNPLPLNFREQTDTPGTKK